MTKRILISALLFSFLAAKLAITCDEAVRQFQGYECVEREAVGEGASGKAFLVKLSASLARPRILKVQEFVNAGKKERALFESNLLKSFNHANVIRLFEDKQTSTHLFEVIEYGEAGSLSKYLFDRPAVRTNRVAILRLFREMLQGVRYMHQNGWIHADLKVDNIVVDQHGNPKLIDFDLTVKAGQVNFKRGTPEYMEADLHRKESPTMKFDQFVDVYALGVVLYEMVNAGRVPFIITDRSRYLSELTDGYYKVYQNTDAEIAWLIHGCLKFDRLRRLTIDQLIDHTDAALANETPWTIAQTKLISTKQDFFEAYEAAILKKHEAFLLTNRVRKDIYLDNGFLVPLPEMQGPEPQPQNGFVYTQNDQRKKLLVNRGGDSRALVVLLGVVLLALFLFLSFLVICKSCRGGGFLKSSGGSSHYSRTVVTKTHAAPVSSSANTSRVVVHENVATYKAPLVVSSQSGHAQNNYSSSSTVSKKVVSGGKVVSSTYQSSSHTKTYRG